ncbi:phage holin family protein [Inconstantimicrobium porci]|uniref:Holin n=1 Tax=Inconstantimicrobium porci TaxID=2652291 RepID=A0A7X2T0P6_9CLOT|nr:phage holin family protein [Inconstantimicrobium porci]MDD6771863.1 phage holin family protein [Inconstantimicrobium porci]MSR90063.1 holin [Inconstantimicrobium porci]
MDLLQFVPTDLMILIPALYIIGMFLKSTPKVKDWTIPWILLALGILGAVLLRKDFSINEIIEGIICAGASVFTNQLFKQTTKGVSSASSEAKNRDNT